MKIVYYKMDITDHLNRILQPILTDNFCDDIHNYEYILSNILHYEISLKGTQAKNEITKAISRFSDQHTYANTDMKIVDQLIFGIKYFLSVNNISIRSVDLEEYEDKDPYNPIEMLYVDYQLFDPSSHVDLLYRQCKYMDLKDDN